MYEGLPDSFNQVNCYVQCKMYTGPYYGIYVRHSCASTKIIYLPLIYLANVAETCSKVTREKKICEVMYCCYRKRIFSFVQLFYTCCNNIFVFDLQGDSLVALDC